MLDAVDRFEAGRGASITSFIGHRVRGAVLDEVRRLDRLPGRLRDDVSKVGRSRDTLAQQLGRASTTPEIAGHAEMAEAAVQAAVCARAATDAVDVDALGIAAVTTKTPKPPGSPAKTPPASLSPSPDCLSAAR